MADLILYAFVGILLLDKTCIGGEIMQQPKTQNRPPYLLLLTVLQHSCQCENSVPRHFWSILNTEGPPLIIEVGLKIAIEGYIEYLKMNMLGNKTNLEAMVYRSQYKREKPHVTVVAIANDITQD